MQIMSNAAAPVRQIETGELLVSILGLCPQCGLGLRGHWYSRFANWCAETDSKEWKHQERFLRAVKDHNWSELRQFGWSDSLGSDLEAYVVHCPIKGLFVAVIKNDRRIFRRTRVLFSECLARNESYKLLADSLVDHWKMF